VNIYAIIPIRGGSKRFPGKNIFEIAGIPLFLFSTHIAQQSNIFSKIIISSDNEDYLNLAKIHNCSVHRRSQRSSSDSASTEDVIEEVIKDSQFKNEDWVFLIQSTNPFQQEKYFKDAVKHIRSNVSSILTFRKFKRFFIEDVIAGERKRTQDLSYRKLETGLFWAFNVGDFLLKKQRIIKPFELVEIDEFDDVDIDYREDLYPHIPRLERLADKIKLQTNK